MTASAFDVPAGRVCRVGTSLTQPLDLEKDGKVISHSPRDAPQRQLSTLPVILVAHLAAVSQQDYATVAREIETRDQRL